MVGGGRGYYDPRPGGNRTPNPEPDRREGEGEGAVPPGPHHAKSKARRALTRRADLC